MPPNRGVPSHPTRRHPQASVDETLRDGDQLVDRQFQQLSDFFSDDSLNDVLGLSDGDAAARESTQTLTEFTG